MALPWPLNDSKQKDGSREAQQESSTSVNRVSQETLDPADLNKDYPIDYGLIGDAGLTLTTLVVAVRERLGGTPRGRSESIAQAIKASQDQWLSEWMPRLTSNEIPRSPYRVLWDVLHTVDVASTVITRDAGSPRDQLSPFWQTREPLTSIGWGKTTQLGYSLGLAIGAKLAHPDKLCINV
jgi:thiamine pyrophosphate-dependent acetolactate synthase large subunit-like protein